MNFPVVVNDAGVGVKGVVVEYSDEGRHDEGCQPLHKP